MRTPDEIRISNRATYWPVAPLDLVVGAPLVVRALLGVTPLGRVVQAAVLGAYLGSAVRDWRDRRGIRKIDFRREFGADVRNLAPMPRDIREAEVRTLAARLNDGFTPRRRPRRELAVEVDRHLTRYIAGITGQRVRTSAEVRGLTLAGLAFPFALGACDMLSGDVAIFKDTGPLEPHVLAHEFSHRKGYWKELHAQVLAYLSLVTSGEPELVQAARLERFHRHLRVLADEQREAFDVLALGASLRPELRNPLGELRPPGNVLGRQLEAGMRKLYDTRMRVTGQAGISDYDLGFTNFLYTFETSTAAKQTPPAT
ncbi:MAG TPA: DUF3810 family protein [Candidatus Limnocylindrales bacterium]|nr:DUF3810 family protein [Candidatus Limnocylindrales bacterium]